MMFKMTARLFGILSVLALLVDGYPSAQADTYNFYFSKPKKEQGKNKKTVEPPSEEEQEESADNQAAQEGPTPASSPTADNSSRQPIVINNNNSYTPTPTYPPSSGNGSGAENQLSQSDYLSGNHSQTRLGVGVLFMPHFNVLTRQPNIGDPDISSEGYLVSLGIKASNSFYVTPYFSYQRLREFKFAGMGCDLEFYPFNSDEIRFRPFELGFIGGVYAAPLMHGLVAYGGSRVNINLSDSFGITGSVKSTFDLNPIWFESGISLKL